MLEQIERKLGKTVEEVLKEEYELFARIPYEAERKNPFSVLSKEELEFLLKNAEMFSRENETKH